MNLLSKLEKSFHFWFLLCTCILFFILRFPSLFEPYWYGDEGIYEAIGFAMRHGRLLYTGIWDNKPPLLYIIYALFNGDQFGAKLASLIFGLLSVITIYFLARRLLHSTIASSISALVFAVLFGLPILEGNIANAENFMILPIMCSGLLIIQNKTSKHFGKLQFFAGLLLSFAFLIKIVGIFDLGAFGLYLLIQDYKSIKLVPSQVIKVTPLIVGFFLPIFVTVAFFLLTHSLGDFINASFSQNVGYVGYGNTFIIPQGLLIAKLILLLVLCCIIFFLRKKIPSQVQFILLWTGFAIFDTFFSQRPYTHYLLVTISSMSLLFGLLFSRYRGKLFFAVFQIGLIMLILNNFHGFGKSIIPYYRNFISFVQNRESVATYQQFFDQNTIRDYEVASFINGNAKQRDSIFIWGNDAQIYKLANKIPPGRFTVAYHINASQKTLNETRQIVYKAKPKYIVVISNAGQYPYSLSQYMEKLKIKDTTIYERTF